MKIVCLYIATGRYTVFWKDFYLSAEKYLLPEAQKDYFMFTDNEHIDFEENANVFKIYQKKLGWPYDTMMRFDMFLTQEEKLKEYDYIYFFNANMEFVAPVGDEFLPDESGLVMGLHPGYYNKKPDEYPYDRNPKSTAYIPYGQGKHYVQGCLNGGTSEAYLELCKTCSANTHKDLEQNIIALWHDESHLNKYVQDKPYKLLACNYLYPEGKKLKPFNKNIKIIQRNKNDKKWGGTDNLRQFAKDTRYKDKFDVVILTATKDMESLNLCTDLLRKNLEFKNLNIISNQKPQIKTAFTYINENKIMSGLSYQTVESYFKSRNIKNARVGWYLQQFIKMAYAFICNDEYYLLWDSDTLMLRPITFFDADGRILFDNSREWKDDVFNKTVVSVLGYERPTDKTFIVEHMMIKTECMRDLVQTIAKNRPIEDFWKIILDGIDDDDLSYGGFSEFEVIGTFMQHQYPDLIAYRPLKSNRNFAKKIGLNITKYDIWALAQKFDFGSIEKKHKIKTAKYKIWCNKIKNFIKYQLQR